MAERENEDGAQGNPWDCLDFGASDDLVEKQRKKKSPEQRMKETLNQAAPQVFDFFNVRLDWSTLRPDQR
jgi:hypothetical protein